MNLKLIMGALLLLVALVFSVQNASVVEVKFLIWNFSPSLALILFGTLIVGLLGGWAITGALQHKRKIQKNSLEQ